MSSSDLVRLIAYFAYFQTILFNFLLTFFSSFSPTCFEMLTVAVFAVAHGT